MLAVMSNMPCANVAPARASVEQASAPDTPNCLMERKTATTMRLSGMPKILTMTERWLSGMYRDRSVPIEGKYLSLVHI